jgi:hypothetical protein
MPFYSLDSDRLSFCIVTFNAANCHSCFRRSLELKRWLPDYAKGPCIPHKRNDISRNQFTSSVYFLIPRREQGRLCSLAYRDVYILLPNFGPCDRISRNLIWLLCRWRTYQPHAFECPVIRNSMNFLRGKGQLPHLLWVPEVMKRCLWKICKFS